MKSVYNPTSSILHWLIVALSLFASASMHAQTLQWAQFTSVAPFGGGNTATSQALPAAVAGVGRGSGIATFSMSVTGGTSSWNGFGVGRNDDGYYPSPNLPQAGITFVTGAPGYLGGVPAAAQASFTAAYNVAGAPAGLPSPTTDRAAVYADSGSGTTLSAQWDFAGLAGGKLPAGSWLFIDGIDQGERVAIASPGAPPSGPNGWLATMHTGDSTLPRASNSFTTLVSSPTFPSCAPAITIGTSSIQLDGRYGDVSQSVPSCSNSPVPVAGQTVGYTKGIDSVGVWVRTAIDLTAISITVFDVDANPPNAPDNNFLLGFGLIAATYEPAPVPSSNAALVALLSVLLLLVGSFGVRRVVKR
jgi:hypothetical protein